MQTVAGVPYAPTDAAPMTKREFQIGMVGTFDVENYGDLLFPLIARAELSQRLGPMNLHCFSYRQKTLPEWPFEVNALSEFPRRVRESLITVLRKSRYFAASS